MNTQKKRSIRFSEIDKQLKLIKAKFLAGKRERFRAVKKRNYVEI